MPCMQPMQPTVWAALYGPCSQAGMGHAQWAAQPIQCMGTAHTQPIHAQWAAQPILHGPYSGLQHAAHTAHAAHTPGCMHRYQCWRAIPLYPHRAPPPPPPQIFKAIGKGGQCACQCMGYNTWG
jgi:hypothetical protein